MGRQRKLELQVFRLNEPEAPAVPEEAEGQLLQPIFNRTTIVKGRTETLCRYTKYFIFWGRGDRSLTL